MVESYGFLIVREIVNTTCSDERMECIMKENMHAVSKWKEEIEQRKLTTG